MDDPNRDASIPCRAGVLLTVLLVGCGASPVARDEPTTTRGLTWSVCAAAEVAATTTRCWPIADCSCWRGCARVEPDTSGPSSSACAYRAIDGQAPGTLLDLVSLCDAAGVCAEVLEGAETCWSSCPESLPGFTCVNDGDGCARVDRPLGPQAAR